MKFLNNSAQFVVNYNTMPQTPASLTTSASACGASLATYAPVLQAQFVDLDGGSLTGNFEWQELPSGTVNTVTSAAVVSGNYGSVTLALDAMAEGKTFQWRVQASDGIATSAWSSPWCTFTISNS
jgi:hypothetical protein